MARYDEYKDRVDHLIELPGVYDGWSIAVLTDGSLINRWESDEGTGPEPGYERRYIRTQEFINAARAVPQMAATWTEIARVEALEQSSSSISTPKENDRG